MVQNAEREIIPSLENNYGNIKHLGKKVLNFSMNSYRVDLHKAWSFYCYGEF